MLQRHQHYTNERTQKLKWQISKTLLILQITDIVAKTTLLYIILDRSCGHRVMCTIFFNIMNVISRRFMQLWQTVDCQAISNVIRELCVSCKCWVHVIHNKCVVSWLTVLVNCAVRNKYRYFRLVSVIPIHD